MDWRLHVNGTKKQVEEVCRVGPSDCAYTAGGAKEVLELEWEKTKLYKDISVSKHLHNIK